MSQSMDEPKNIFEKELNINSIKGITLVALVVTIVVLLILSGITIQLIMGDTGIFATAQRAKIAQEIGELKDRIAVQILDWSTEKVFTPDLELNSLWDRFIKEDIINVREDVRPSEDKENVYEVSTKKGYLVELIVHDDGRVTIGEIVEEDKLLPKINEVIVTKKTTNSIDIQVKISRLAEGKLTYLYKKEGEAESSYKELKRDTTDLTASYTGLEQNVIYNIKVVAENKNGKTEKIVNVITGELPSGTITQKGETIWSNGKANIELETSETGYTLQYQINSREEVWQDYTGVIGNLNHGDIVYARLYDGTNGSNTAIVNIEDGEIPQGATISLSSTSATAGTAINATVTHRDNESGIAIANCKWVYNTNPNNIGTNAASYTGGTFSSNPQTISLNTSTPGTYFLHVLSTDVAGKQKETVSSAVIVKSPNVANAPKLGTGMTPIKWNGSTWVTTTANDSQWYDYSTTAKKWANAQTSDGSMWVWIPRYAYQIPKSNWHTGTAGTINIKFLQGTSNTASDGTTSWSNTSGGDLWNVHPAFSYGSEVAGIWVAKFEASQSDAGVKSADYQNYTGGTSGVIKIQPGVNSWRNIGINDIYNKCLSYNSTLNSHQMKNSEWGAVAYLAQSVYGKNSEVWINNSSSYITGSSGNSVSASSNTGTSTDYKSEQSLNASTTGNIYGIYDMSGGSWEYVAAYINNGHSNLKTYGANLVSSSVATKTRDAYSSKTSSGEEYTQRTDYETAKAKYGDVVYETSLSGNDKSGSWYGDYALFPYGSFPFFIRGGGCSEVSYAGLFYFHHTTGSPYGFYGFRPVLVVL